MTSHAMVSQQELRPDIPKSVLQPDAVENGSQALEHGIPVAPKEGDENRPEIPTALRPTSPYRVGTDANADTNACSMPKWNSSNHPGSIITGLANEPDRFVDEVGEGRQGCELPCPAKPSFCQEAQQADVGPHREDSFRALARDITAFSPYAARLGGRHSLDDDVADAAARLEGLRLEVQRDGREDIDVGIDSMPSQAQEQRANKDYAPPPRAGIARKMEFYQENVHPDASPEMGVTVPQPKGVLTNTEKLEESPSCLVARVPTMLGRLQQEGDEPKNLPVVADRRTLVVNATACLLHMGSEEFGDHQETPKRLELLCGEQGALRRTAFQGLEWADPSEVKPAVVTDLLRVHEYDYLLHIEERCKGAPSAIPPAGKHIEGNNNGGGGIYAASRNVAERTVSSKALPPGSLKTSSSRSGEFGDRFTPDASYVDVDTRVSRESYQAARMAAGAVITAVDRVVQGKNPNAFVAVRPPGHHAGPSGSSPAASFWKNPAMNSSGFCLLNNAAIGAAYARSRYGRTGEVSRVAIVDIDIHHGNGTEEIVRCLRPTTTRLPLPSSWPPMFKTVYKPWLDDRDADSVFFGSVSLQDKDSFYPASGTEQERFGDNDNIVNVSLTALGPTPGEETKKRALTKTKMTEYTNKARAELKAKCTRTLLARLKKFSPDLLIISAGFDGHVEDYYHYLSDDCYEWITLALEECVPSGRVVSVLEGGYSLQPRVSKSKATQARANAKRTSKPEPSSGASSKAFDSGGVGAISSSSCRHPALRERRSRPATRGMNASSSSAPCIPSAAAAAAMTASIKSRPVPPLAPPPTSGTFPTASLGAVAPALSDLEAPASTYDAVSRSPADRISFGVGGLSTGTYVSGGGAAFSALETLPAGFESVGFVAEAGVSLTRVLGEKTRDHLGVAPIVLADPPASAPSAACNDVIGKHLSVRGGNPSSKVGMLTGAGGIASQVGKEEELPLVRPEDGGLVRGVVSHVNALVVASGRGGNGVGEAFSTVETPRKQACF